MKRKIYLKRPVTPVEQALFIAFGIVFIGVIIILASGGRI